MNEDARRNPKDVLHKETGWTEAQLTFEVEKFPSSIRIVLEMRDVDLGTIWCGLALGTIFGALHDSKSWDPKEQVILKVFCNRFVFP